MMVVFILLIIVLGALTPPRFRWPVVSIYSVLVAASLCFTYCNNST